MPSVTRAKPCGALVHRRRSGVTLVELLVTLTLLSLLFAVSIAVGHFGRGGSAPLETRAARVRGQLIAARREALRTGRAVTVVLNDDGVRADVTRAQTVQRVYAVTAFPDGSVSAEGLPSVGLVLDYLSGSLKSVDKNDLP